MIRESAGPRTRASYADLHHISPEIIVIGAGIAGTALSYALSKTRSVLLLERDLSEPDRIVGELLQPRGVAALHELGLGDVLDGIDATPVEGYCVVAGDRQVAVPYPNVDLPSSNRSVTANFKKSTIKDTTDEVSRTDGTGKRFSHGNPTPPRDNRYEGELDADKDGWYVETKSGRKEGRSFHHGRLITSLRRKCIHESKATVLEATVRELIFCEHTDRVIGVTAAFKVSRGKSIEGEIYDTMVKNIYAPLTIIADGCFSKFRSVRGSRIPVGETRSHFVGVVLKDAELPLPRHGTVCLTGAGPVLFYQIGHKARETRMLVDVKGKLPSVADGNLRDFIIESYVPFLPASLRENVIEALQSQRLRTMPNTFLRPSIQGLPHSTLSGAIIVGDAYNMRHPLTGGGMTVAFHDVIILNRMLAPGGDMGLTYGREGLEDWAKIARGLRLWFWERKALSGVVNVLSIALYDLFGGSDEPDLEVLREGCFRYFQLGGNCVEGPVGLLSALTPKPLTLFYHFFNVAFYSIWILMTEGLPPRQESVPVKPNWLQTPRLLIISVRVFITACFVLLPVMFTEGKI